MLYRLLAYFRGVPEIGPLLAGKLLGLILVGFFSILLLSNIITALSSFFLARDLDLLVVGAGGLAQALRREAARDARALELDGGADGGPDVRGVRRRVPRRPAVSAHRARDVRCRSSIMPAVIGSAITLLLVNIFPARRTRDILSVIAVLAAGGIVLLFRIVRPERLARPEGFRSLVDFITVLRAPTSPLLPSEWVQRAVMAWLDVNDRTCCRSTCSGRRRRRRSCSARCCTAGSTRSASARRRRAAQRWARGRLDATRRRIALLAPFGIVRRELVLKEVRLFFRDTTQWSQLILLAVLVVVYVFNIKFLPLRGEGMTFFLVNVVPFLNLVLAGFVLASVAARFIFPGVSLEGRTFWLLRSSPMPMRELLWAKFWVGTLPLLVLALAIVGVTDYLLQVSDVHVRRCRSDDHAS